MITLHITNRWGRVAKIPFGEDLDKARQEQDRYEDHKDVVSTKITGIPPR